MPSIVNTIHANSGAKRRLGGVIYILPNLLTTGNLFFGFFSIIKALNGQFGWAASAIFLAAIFDILDGRVARLTRATSEFGVQYDSLCDLVSFGLAPAFLMFQFGLSQIGRIGWIACFIFLACGALRLARFNVQSSIGKAGGDFVGLPIPMAALVVATFIALNREIFGSEEHDNFLLNYFKSHLDELFLSRWFMLGLAFFLAYMMVSNFPYRSHKTLKFKGVRPFRLLAFSVVILGLIAFMPEFFGFVLVFAFSLSGPVEWLLGRRTTEDEDIFTSHEEGAVFEPADPSQKDETT